MNDDVRFVLDCQHVLLKHIKKNIRTSTIFKMYLKYINIFVNILILKIREFVREKNNRLIFNLGSSIDQYGLFSLWSFIIQCSCTGSNTCTTHRVA